LTENDYIPAVKWRLLGLSADGEILPKLIETMRHHRSCAPDAKLEIVCAFLAGRCKKAR